MTSLSASVRIQRGDFRLEADLEARAGETLGLLGPNGAGKTTLVHALAGLCPIGSGEVRVGDELWESSDRGVRLVPQQRSVGVVFQGFLLFPALSALDNVAYGLRARGAHRKEARRRGLELMRRFDIAHVASRAPGVLSGGES